MDPVSAGVGGTIGNVAGSVIGFLGNRETNATNIELADRTGEWNLKAVREAAGFNQASADKQMAFQERMSNSAYQRAMADMKAAGLNPMLAFMKGGADSPGGSSASMTPASRPTATVSNSLAHLGEGVKTGVNSALAAVQQATDIEKTQAEIRSVDTDTAYKAIAAGKLATTDTKLGEAQASSAKGSARASNIRAAADEVSLPAVAAEANLRKKRAEIDKQMAWVDAVIQRVHSGGAALNSALDTFKNRWNPFGGPQRPNPSKPETLTQKQRDKIVKHEAKRFEQNTKNGPHRR